MIIDIIMQERVKVLSECIVELQATREKHQPTLNSVNNIAEKVVGDDRLTTSNRVRGLRVFYKTLAVGKDTY